MIDPKVVEVLVAAKASAERSPAGPSSRRASSTVLRRDGAGSGNNAAIAEALVITDDRSRSTSTRSLGNAV